MATSSLLIQAVTTSGHLDSAASLISEYLNWVAGIARENYGLSFDVEAMVQSDIGDRSKFFPPTGCFHLLGSDNQYIGVGCLKRLDARTCELQRMYVQPHVRGMGAGRLILQRLLADARELGYGKVRLESLKALSAAHALYHSAGFVEIQPYAENSMRAYQASETLGTYSESAVFMELNLGDSNDA